MSIQLHIRLRTTLAAATLLCLLLFAAGARGQRFPFHNLSVDDGLVQSQATCLAQDKTGYLWIGTLGGLSRYDGRNFTNFTVKNGLQSNGVLALNAASDGTIWIGGITGISQYNGKTFRHYPRPQHASRATINTQQIQVIGDTTWWRVQGEVYYIANGKIKYWVVPGEPGYITAMLAEGSGLWAAKNGAIYHYTGGKWDTLRFMMPIDAPTDAAPPAVYRIWLGKDRQVMAATGTGLYQWDGQLMVPVYINHEPLPLITGAATDKAGALWLTSNNGMIRLAGNNAQYFNKQNGLSDNTFNDVLSDAEGNIWMASDGHGIYRYSGTQFTSLDETMGLPSAQVMAFAAYTQDSLILGTYDGGLFVFYDGNVHPMPFPAAQAPSINSLCFTAKGKLWIGTRGRGLWSYEKDLFRQYEAPYRGFPSNFINCVKEDQEGRLWIGFADGAMVFENDSFKTVIAKNVPVFSFLSIGADSTLIATESGLMLHHAGNTVPFVTGTVLDSSLVQCFTLQGKALWAGSNENGVIRYQMDTHTARVFNKNDGLKSDFIYNIVADNAGNIWVGTGFGIHRIEAGNGHDGKVTFYGKAQGITGMESNINAVLKQPDGSIWFGTTNGAVHYQPSTSVVSAAPTSIVMQAVKLPGEATIEAKYYDSSDNWYGVPYHLQLPFRKNNIAFTYQAITLNGAQQVQYRYLMEGLDAPWSDWSATNSVSYSALPPGKYTFRVQCKGADGASSPDLVYDFEIITPIQKTTWFRFAVLAACILLGIMLQYVVTSRKQRRETLLAKLRAEEQGKIRQRTAEDFHDEIGNRLTRINVLTNVLKNKVTLTPDTERILGQIEENVAQLYGGTRDILWSLKPSNDNLYEILHRIRDFGGELMQDTEVNFTFTGTDEKWKKHRLPMDMSRNLIMIFKEAMNNSLKYAQAKNITLEVTLKNRDTLQLILKDDGKGFDQQTVQKGNGLNNMKVRAERLNGRLYIDSHKDKGTIINLTFRIPLHK